MNTCWPIEAWKDAGVKIDEIDCDEMTVTFSNGVILPILAFYDADGHRVEEPTEPGYAEFGDDEYGYGNYPVKIISEREYERQRARTAAARAQSAPPARPN